MEITINRPNHLENTFFIDIEVDQERLGSTEHFGTKFEENRCKSAFQNKLFGDISDPAGYSVPSGHLPCCVLYRTRRAKRPRREEKCWK